MTTGDSSLSACIQSIVAAECGKMDQAVEYARYAVLMDLGDVGGNVQDGCHMASMGGTWMIFANGFGGMQDYDGRISFRPRLSEQMTRLRFSLVIRGQTLAVDIGKDSTTYLLKEGSGLIITHYDEEISLSAGQPVSAKVEPG